MFVFAAGCKSIPTAPDDNNSMMNTEPTPYVDNNIYMDGHQVIVFPAN